VSAALKFTLAKESPAIHVKIRKNVFTFFKLLENYVILFTAVDSRIINKSQPSNSSLVINTRLSRFSIAVIHHDPFTVQTNLAKELVE
jgi:hypothetical protein